MVRLLWLLLLLPLIPVLGLLYQWVGSRYDRRRFLRLGRLVDIGKRRRLFMTEMGSGSGPSVIFESGIGATSQNWARIQQSVSEFAHTVSYDRLGLGWSTPAVSERIPSNVVEELRAMLQAAGIAPPYLLVGHSFGGLVVRYFAGEYPDEVVGAVLVDAMRTDEWPPVDESQRKLLNRGAQLTQWGVLIAYSGLARLTTMSFFCRSGKFTKLFTRATGGHGVLERLTSELDKMPSAVWPIVAAHWSSPAFFRGMTAHIHGVPGTVMEMHDATPIVGIPVVLMTPGHSKAISNEDLRRIGPDAEQRIAEKSGHWLHLDEPELVIEQIRDMVTAVRAGLFLRRVDAGERLGRLRRCALSVGSSDAGRRETAVMNGSHCSSVRQNPLRRKVLKAAGKFSPPIRIPFRGRDVYLLLFQAEIIKLYKRQKRVRPQEKAMSGITEALGGHSVSGLQQALLL